MKYKRANRSEEKLASQDAGLDGALASTRADRRDPYATVEVPGVSGLPSEIAKQGQYKVLRPIGAGGMGQVYLAKHLLTERLVALKVMRCESQKDDLALERFLREIRALSSIEHPNVIRIYSAERFGNTVAMAMEFANGSDLRELVQQSGALATHVACRYIEQAAKGLHHAHGAGVIHRDIKPSNLLLEKSGKTNIVKIADFGLARFVDDSSPHTHRTPAGYAMGTLGFMAPEQASDARTAGVHADIFSLGRTLHFLLTGRHPYDQSSKDWRKMIFGETEICRLDKLRIDLPKGLVAVVDKMTARTLDSRYQDCEQVADAISKYCDCSSQNSRWWQLW